MDMQTNIDDIRAEIMRLESAPAFDQKAWARVLIQLADHPTRRADAARRMETAMHNQPMPMHVRTDLGMMGGDEIELTLVPVSMATGKQDGFEWHTWEFDVVFPQHMEPAIVEVQHADL